jgi:S-ribosylhomocysteine lyase
MPELQKIASFTVNHEDLEPGVYVSRVDRVGAAGEPVTTFDLRLTCPNDEPVMGTAEVHTIEHLAATFLRNDPEWAGRVVYFGPMGCRTGFYLILAGELSSRDVVGLVTRCFEFVRDFEGDIPGAAPRDCGNWRDQNLDFAHWYARRYLDETLYCIDDAHLNYPA